MTSNNERPSATETVIGYPIASFAVRTGQVVSGEIPRKVDPLVSAPGLAWFVANTDRINTLPMEVQPLPPQPLEIEPTARRWPFAVGIAIAIAALGGIATYLMFADTDAPAASRPVVAPALATPPKPARVPVAPPRAVAPAPAPVAKPEAPSCAVLVEADQPHSAVLIEGKVAGETPIDISGLPCGRAVHVTVVHPQRVPWQRTIVPAEGKVALLSAELAHPTTALAVTSVPSGAMVRVNGRDVTSTPAAITLVAGVTSQIEIVLPGYTPYRQRIVMREGTAAPIDAVLVKRP